MYMMQLRFWLPAASCPMDPVPTNNCIVRAEYFSCYNTTPSIPSIEIPIPGQSI